MQEQVTAFKKAGAFVLKHTDGKTWSLLDMLVGTVMLIVRGRHYLTGEVRDFQLADGLIQAIRRPTAVGATLGRDADRVAPGLIDIQVIDYHGNGFCRGNVTVERVG